MSTEIEVPGGNDIASILLRAAELDASDVHLTVGEPPCMRFNGKIVPTRMPVLDKDQMHHMIYDILDDEKRRIFESEKELDFAFQLGDAGRFRANCFYTMKGEGAVFRVIPTEIRSFSDLGLPPVLMKVSTRPRGLVLVTGPTGSGKSTTLAAMIDYVNCNRDDHIITIEDPIEFVHKNKRCIVNQREVGSSTNSFSNALRSALREDPDIVLVGELRDLETISLALTASETGHLVFGTLHTQSAPKTCDRLVDVFPPEQQKLVRVMFSESFEAIVCQTLIPKANGKGRALAMEIMLGVPATRSLIREGKTHQLTTIIQTGQKMGMQSLDQCLKDLLQRRVISEYDALARSNNPDTIMPMGIQKLEEYLARESKASARAGEAPKRGIQPPPQNMPHSHQGAAGSPQTQQRPPAPGSQQRPPAPPQGNRPPAPPPPSGGGQMRPPMPPAPPGNRPPSNPPPPQRQGGGPPPPPLPNRGGSPPPQPPSPPGGGGQAGPPGGGKKPQFPFGPKK